MTVDSTLKSPTPPYNTLYSVNMPYVSVTFCVPGKQGASQCATVDHMVLDTGSVGVRVMSTALGAALAASLPAQTGASNDGTGKAVIAQCTSYVSGYMWGPTRLADVTIGGEKASSLPVQVVGDSTFAWTPSDCSSRQASAMNTVDDLGANGVVGIGPRATDIPLAATSLLAANYYYCPTPWSCTNATVPLDKQTGNPVSAFPVDNNGTIIQLPAVAAAGQPTVTGQLVFGIGTRENNALPVNPTLTLATDSAGMFTTTYKGRTMWSSIDSGSNALFFQDSTLPAVRIGDPDKGDYWFAPGSTQNLSATMISRVGSAQTTVPFSLANAPSLFAMGYAAYGNLGAPISTYFLWGLPFFYGRNVYTVMSGAKVGTQTGPYIVF
ncbi:DUF3443 family protein [Paraburkholderia bengalensis]|uniref:DUF3443 family protein n=1 Tax=Paraburkholderia bengalensis TaxID=2747562 RepID=UPI0030152463